MWCAHGTHLKPKGYARAESFEFKWLGGEVISTTVKAQSAERKALLRRRIRWLVTATISYNIIEAVVSVSAGLAASSGALVSFGLDSLIEVFSAVAVAWQFSQSEPERFEKPTLRAISISFFALGIYVIVNAVLSMTGVVNAEHSTPGIVITSLSLIVMPILSLLQRRTGRELGSATAVADSKQTLLCTYLSAAVLLSLLLNTLFGWSWTDPIAALIIGGVAIREGRQAWKGHLVCC